MATLAQGALGAGAHLVQWTPDARLGAGIYLVRFDAEGAVLGARIALLR